jgi:hypothetical protein
MAVIKSARKTAWCSGSSKGPLGVIKGIFLNLSKALDRYDLSGNHHNGLIYCFYALFTQKNRSHFFA